MKRSGWICVVIGLSVVGGGGIWAAGRFARHEVAGVSQMAKRPKVTGVEPADGAVEISPVTGIKAAVSLPGGAGVDENTLAAGVSLVRVRDGAKIDALLNTSGAGDVVVLKPKAELDLGTEYRFVVTAALKDTAGQSFDAKTVTFTTAKTFAVADFPAAFEKLPLPNMKLERDAFTSLAIGPDGKLYAATFAGMIHVYAINADGTTTEEKPITAIMENNKGPRLITGIAFDPLSTRRQGVLWVSHGQFAMKNGRPEGADDWTGKISWIGTSAGYVVNYTDVITGLPRAYKDHLNFQLAFGPDGALYFSQGSNTSVGDVDVKWGYRPERNLTAAILRLDLQKVFRKRPSAADIAKAQPATAWPPSKADMSRIDNKPWPVVDPAGGQQGDQMTLPLDVKTEDGGTYDPAAANAPLTLYATGVRSGFKLLFHRNGHLYTGVNGAAGNEGNVPASPDGKWPAVRDIKQTTDDLLLKIEKGAYYGHPNPARGQYALNGANPTAGVDPLEVPAYPVGTPPDPNWHKPAYVFGKNYSPNGLIDYHGTIGEKGNAKPGPAAALDGCILVTRYSDGKDVLVLRLDDNGDVVETIAGLDGFTGLNAPLDLVEDPKTGNLYVAEYRGQQVTLLRPKPNGVSPHAQRTAVTR